VWVFNETLTKRPEYCGASFVSNGIEHSGMTEGYSNGYTLMYLGTSTIVYFYSNNTWANEAYRTVDFGETEKDVSDRFYNWFVSEAVQEGGQEPDVPSRTNGYLIRSNSTIYTITDGTLTALAETEITASLFQTYGTDEIPDGALLVGLTDPEVLFWRDSDDELPDLTITVKGTPPLPQIFTSESMDLTHESIAGIDHAAVDASADVRFAISFDNGTTWQAFDGSGWFNVSDTAPGMLASTMNAITTEQWAGIVQLTAYRLRFWLPNVTAYVKSVVIHYINP
jgi:hypothetical protein